MEQMTITVSFNRIVFNPWESTVKNGLRSFLGDIADIDSVERPLFSDRYAIAFTPRQRMTQDAWKSAFLAALMSMGYDSVEIFALEGGGESSYAGGISSVVKEGTAQVQGLFTKVVIIAVIGFFVWANIGRKR